MNGWILAIIATLDPSVAPHWEGWMETRDACMQAAQKANANDPRLKTPEIKRFGPKYVCLKAESDA